MNMNDKIKDGIAVIKPFPGLFGLSPVCFNCFFPCDWMRPVSSVLIPGDLIDDLFNWAC